MEHKRTVSGVCPHCCKSTTHTLIGADIYRCKRCKRTSEIKDIYFPKKETVEQRGLFA